MSEIKNCDKKMSLPQISGTCWFNAILTLLFFSDGMRNYLKIVIQDLLKNVDTNQKINIKKKPEYIKILMFFSDLIIMSELNDKDDFKAFYENNFEWYELNKRFINNLDNSFYRKDKIKSILSLMYKYDPNTFNHDPEKKPGGMFVPYIISILNFLQIRDNVMFLNIDSSGNYKYSVLNTFELNLTPKEGKPPFLLTQRSALNAARLLRGETFRNMHESTLRLIKSFIHEKDFADSFNDFKSNIHNSKWSSISYALYNIQLTELDLNDIEVVIILDDNFSRLEDFIMFKHRALDVSLYDQQTQQPLKSSNGGIYSEYINISKKENFLADSKFKITGKHSEALKGSTFTTDGSYLNNNNHAIAGITCNKKRYIFNGHTKVRIEDPKSNLRACYFQPFEWLTDEKCFSIADNKCEIKGELPKTTREETLCFNTSKKSIKILVKSHHTSSLGENARQNEILAKKTQKSIDSLPKVKNVGFGETLKAAFFGSNTGGNGLRIPKKKDQNEDNNTKRP